MSYESERATRRSRIDPKLKAAGWKVVPPVSYSDATGDHLAVEEFETPLGPADYALFDGGRYCVFVHVGNWKDSKNPDDIVRGAELVVRAVEEAGAGG